MTVEECIFDLPVKEHSYVPQDEMWLLPGDLSKEFDSWPSLDNLQQFSLMSRFRKAVRDGRAVVCKVDLPRENDK